MDINEKQVVKLYTVQAWTLRRIAEKFFTNHHMIKRILVRNSVTITNADRRRPMFTEEHKQKIGNSSKGRIPYNKGVPADETQKRKYIASRMRTKINLDAYPDLLKLQFLVKLTSKHFRHLGFSDDVRKPFLDKFYHDRAFNTIFDEWQRQEENKWWYPSLDHINPKSNGGTFDLDNLQFLTWFENRAKADMNAEEWAKFKHATGTTSKLFLEEILIDYRK